MLFGNPVISLGLGLLPTCTSEEKESLVLSGSTVKTLLFQNKNSFWDALQNP
jgi:hypothetical protein